MSVTSNPLPFTRRVAIMFAVAAGALLGTTCADARSIEDIRKSGTLVIASEGKFSPFNFVENGKLAGFEIDIANAIAQKMGLKAEWKTMGFDGLLVGLGQDRWDMVISSHGITEERAKAVTFATPHYCTGGVIISKDGAIRTAKDLTGKVVAVQTGTTYYDNVKKLPVKDVRNFPQDSSARAALETGHVDEGDAPQIQGESAEIPTGRNVSQLRQEVAARQIEFAFENGDGASSPLQ